MYTCTSSNHTVDSQSELSESYEEEEEEEEEGEGEGERTDSPRFTPFPNRNTVTSESYMYM